LKFLFDENLSARLPTRLGGLFAGSTHVDELDLRGQPDDALWARARAEGFAIISKDGDFADMSFVRGHPPKVVLLRVGNAGTMAIEALLRRCVHVLERFEADEVQSLLELTDRR
jgi:predicted nuclease of predicted toxin-antitoxin system